MQTNKKYIRSSNAYVGAQMTAYCGHCRIDQICEIEYIDKKRSYMDAYCVSCGAVVEILFDYLEEKA